jgi:hypothetical protein
VYRNCISDQQIVYNNSDEDIYKRFDFYKQIGTNVLRVEVSWRDFETVDGSWVEPKVLNYITIAEKYGFRIKLILGVMMAPPAWYMTKYPESRLRDENGNTSENSMSLWYPDLKPLITEKSERLVSILKEKGLWDMVDYVIPSMGPAGEPLYPAQWTTGLPTQTFWGYDVNAHKSFRAWAQTKYSTVGAANASWSTSFTTWNDVVVLKPGQKPGQYWDDMLTWYRDSKRDYVRWQVDQTLDLVVGTNKKVLIYVPGIEYTDDDWTYAVASAGGNDNIKIMTDSKFLIDLASEKNSMLQYTGMPSENEVKRLRRYMDSKKYNVDMWGENAGDAISAGNPYNLARIIVENKLFGLDYTHGSFLFNDNSLKPNGNMANLKFAFETINK